MFEKIENVVDNLKHILYLFGALEVMICHNGTQFVFRNVRTLVNKWCIRLQTTDPYSQQVDPVDLQIELQKPWWHSMCETIIRRGTVI